MASSEPYYRSFKPKYRNFARETINKPTSFLLHSYTGNNWISLDQRDFNLKNNIIMEQYQRQFILISELIYRKKCFKRN